MKKIENILTTIVVVSVAIFFFVPVLLTVLDRSEMFFIWLACALCLALFEAWLVFRYLPKHIIKEDT